MSIENKNNINKNLRKRANPLWKPGANLIQEFKKLAFVSPNFSFYKN